MSETKRIGIKEFQERGYLQEANRLFFHPLGLALEVIIDGEDLSTVRLGGIWDSRDDPEGIVFIEFDEDKAVSVQNERQAKCEVRKDLSCCDEIGIQIAPYPEECDS